MTICKNCGHGLKRVIIGKSGMGYALKKWLHRKSENHAFDFEEKDKCHCINPEPDYANNSKPNLTNRIVKCAQCGVTCPSTKAIAFFEYRPDKEYDLHYDGYRGWD